MKKTTRIFGAMAIVAISGFLMIKVAKAVEAPSTSPTTSPANSDTANKEVTLSPSVSVGSIVVDKYTPETDQLSGSFVMSNDNDALVGDLGYTVTLIDAAPNLKPNTIAPETYLTYASQTSLNVTSLTPKEKKTIPFKLAIPAVPKNDYRIRIRVQTSNNFGLGWDNVDVSLGKGTDFIITPTAWVAKTADLKHKSFTLDGLNVDPASDVTLGFSYVNVGTKSMSITPNIGVFETKTSNAKVSEQAGEKILDVVPSKKAKQGMINIKAPTVPGSYTIFLAFKDDNGTTVSDTTEYRLVVKGASGKIVSAVFKELTSTKAQIDVAIVGPADDTSTLEATTTVALFDGDKQVSEQTTKAEKLSGETSTVVPINFVFNLQSALQDPGLKVTLKDTKGNVLDTYFYKVPAPKTSVGQSVQPQQNQTTAKPNILLLVLGILIAVAGIAGAIFSLTRTRKHNISSTISMLLLVVVGFGIIVFNLPTVRAATYIGNYLTYFSASAPAAGAGNSYYFYGTSWTGNTSQGLSAYINQPNTVDQTAVISKTNIPVSFSLYWSKCGNRGSNAGIAVDHLKSGGKIVPTRFNWIPFHDYFAHADSIGNTGLALGYAGTLADNVNWTQNIAPQYYNDGVWGVSGSVGSGTYDYSSYLIDGDVYYKMYTTYAGLVSIPENVANTTLRIMGYKVHFLTNGTWSLSNWFGIYGWLNFPNNPPTRILTLTPPAVAGGQATATMTVTDIDGDLAKTEHWALQRPSSSSNATWSQSSYAISPALPTDQIAVGVDSPTQTTNVFTNTFTPDVEGQYCVQARALDRTTGGLWTDLWSTYAAPNPSVTYGPCFTYTPPVPAPTCDNVSGSVSNPIILQAHGGDITFYQWTATQGSPTKNPSSGIGASIEATYSTAGTYQATVTSGGQTSAPCTVIVNNLQPLTCSVIPTKVYTDDTVTFRASGGSGTYAWTPPSGATNITGQNTSEMTAKLSESGSQSATVTSAGVADCSATASVYNKIIPGDVREL